ncbi:cobalamin biosynthesis protein [Patulibacter sp. SYSU D01012]|uniref:cobalamin biosynthesis protein n=1 Tax=Patulibacter sp. SYSU D01012 TaxID=2817381 RepID=UPI001B315C27
MPGPPDTPATGGPRAVVLGVGASRGCPPDELAALADATLAEAGRGRADVVAVASAEIKADEPAVLALAAALGVPARFLPGDALAAVAVPTPSAVVAAAVGTPSVAEASALLVAGGDDPRAARLLVTKRRSARATCAVATAAPAPAPRRVVTATDDCRGCGGCVRTCPEHALVPVGAARADGTFAVPASGAAGGVPLLTLVDRCTGCGECLEICPVDAFIEVALP